MNDDLGDVGLNALEALEAQDQQEQENSVENNAEEEKNNEASDNHVGASEESKDSQGNENSDGAQESSDSDNTDDKDNQDDSKEDKEEQKKELTDEEFEELAKKRGYSKTKAEDKAEEGSGQDQMSKLLNRPKEINEDVWDELPQENKIVYNALPYLIAEGKRGVVQVKTPDQLPDGFEFKDNKAMMKFQNDMQAQENRATELMKALEARAENERRVESDRAEAQKVISEISSLQKSGELPTPKTTYGKDGFDNDPAVLTINKVLNYRAMRASQGVMLSVRDSLLLYKAEHPDEFIKKEAKGDIERKNIAKKVAGNSKAVGTAVNGRDDNKPNYYRPGMSTEDVLDAVLNDME
jgi:hypothetical protein|nr:MAG TPA: hypothetical protein [Caudoviricetes sp.]